MYCSQKLGEDFAKFLWPSQNIWTLPYFSIASESGESATSTRSQRSAEYIEEKQNGIIALIRSMDQIYGNMNWFCTGQRPQVTLLLRLKSSFYEIIL